MSDSVTSPTSNETPNRLRLKLWSSLGAAMWLSAPLVGCDTDSQQAEAPSETARDVHGEGEGEGEAGYGERGEAGEGEGEGERSGLALGEGGEGEGVEGEGEGGEGGEGEGGEGGEGEGGEGEGGGVDIAVYAEDDAAYLTQLGLIRGHLAVGRALYAADLPDLAATHMKHPRAEIYADLEEAFESRGCGGFANELSALAAAVTGKQSKAAVESAYATLLSGIAACEQSDTDVTPKVAATVIENLLRTAGDEYAIGIVEGAINNLHEYQDAWGFTQIAAEWARDGAFASSPRATAVAGQLQDIVAGLNNLWPSLNPQGTVDGRAAALFGAAARVEIGALPLDS
ncbi:MAG: hypothetical protein AAF515_03505 [Pseudomonadota bacterium]